MEFHTLQLGIENQLSIDQDTREYEQLNLSTYMTDVWFAIIEWCGIIGIICGIIGIWSFTFEMVDLIEEAASDSHVFVNTLLVSLL